MAGTTVYVNPAAQTSGSGSLANPLNTWSGVKFTAGTTYLQMAGTVAQGPLTVSTAATAAAPIKIGSYGSGAAPVILGTVTFEGASHVSLTGFDISGGNAAGIVVQNGSNNLQINSNTVSASSIGLWLGNGAGGGDTISNNAFIGNAMFGIAVSGVVNPAGQQTVMSGNVVAQTGGSGIELEGSNFLIQGNTVLQSGMTMGGVSGIHNYSTGMGDGFGDNNTITGNVVAGTGSAGSADGNGIEMDQWTHDDVVTGNIVAGNEGSGIAIYDSWNNSVSGNMVYANDAAPAAQYGANGELSVASSLNLTHGNTISGNTFIGISAYAPVVCVDAWSCTSGNMFSGNVYEDFGAFALYDWGGMGTDNSASYWHTVTGGSDILGGTLPNGGTSYDYDFMLPASPFAKGFHFAWQSAGAYGG